MKALVVIDMQNDFIDGALGSNDAIKTVSVIKEKIEKANRENSIVIATRDIHPENYLSDIEGKCVPRHCIRGEKGSEITSVFSNLKFDLIIGNPPYVRVHNLAKLDDFKCFSFAKT